MWFLSDNGITSVASDVVVTVFFVLFTVGTIVAAIAFLCKNTEGGEIKHKKIALATILAVGFVMRLAFALCIRGYREDYKVFTDMFVHLKNNGIKGYYSGDPSSVLYPIVYFIYLIFGGLSNVMGLTDLSPGLGAQFMVKLPIIIADILAAFGIYKIASLYFNKRVGLVCCALVCVCPIFFVGSVVWTTPLAYTACFLVFCFLYLAKKQYATCIAFATAAAFSSKEGIYIFPAILVFGIYHIVRAAKNIKANKPVGKEIFSAEYNAVIFVPLGFVLSVLGAYLIGLFMTASYSYNIFMYIYEFTIMPLVKWEYFTYNGLSIYSIFGLNGGEPTARFPFGVFTAIFAAISLAVVCIVYLSKRNRATMVMLASYIILTMQVYYPGSTAVSGAVVFLPMLAAYLLVKDKRILHSMFAIGIVYVLNCMSVLGVAGYLNNLIDHYFVSGEYTGSTLLSEGYSAIPIVCSVITVLAHIYYTIVTVNVGMTGQKLPLEAADGVVDSLKQFFAIKRTDNIVSKDK